MPTSRRKACAAALAAHALSAALILSASSASAQSMVSRLDVAREALVQVQELIASGDLGPSWADSLTGVELSVRNVKGFAEYAVVVQRAGGSPATVTLYFNMQGDPTGSSLDE
jgi:hypothetical protein